MTALPGVKLKAEQVAVQSVPPAPCLLPTAVEHPSIVARENQKRVVGNLGFGQHVHHLANDPVQLVNKIAVSSRLARALEALGRSERVVNVARREVEEKRVAGLCLGTNPISRPAGEGGSDLFIVVQLVRLCSTADGVGFKFLIKRPCLRRVAVDEWIRFIEADNPVVFDVNKRWMTVHHRQAEIGIKAKFQRARLEQAIPVCRGLGAEAEVPFADARRVVARAFRHIGNCRASGINHQRRPEENRRPQVAAPHRVTPCQQRVA